MPTLRSPEERAEKIVGTGGQILLPFKIGDASVEFASRWELAKLIAQAIRDALEAERSWYA